MHVEQTSETFIMLSKLLSLVQDQSYNLLTCSPAWYNCAMAALNINLIHLMQLWNIHHHYCRNQWCMSSNLWDKYHAQCVAVVTVVLCSDSFGFACYWQHLGQLATRDQRSHDHCCHGGLGSLIGGSGLGVESVILLHYVLCVTFCYIVVWQLLPVYELV